MDTQRTDLSSSLPTRRSRREENGAPASTLSSLSTQTISADSEFAVANIAATNAASAPATRASRRNAEATGGQSIQVSVQAAEQPTRRSRNYDVAQAQADLSAAHGGHPLNADAVISRTQPSTRRQLHAFPAQPSTAPEQAPIAQQVMQQRQHEVHSVPAQSGPMQSGSIQQRSVQSASTPVEQTNPIAPAAPLVPAAPLTRAQLRAQHLQSDHLPSTAVPSDGGQATSASSAAATAAAAAAQQPITLTAPSAASPATPHIAPGLSPMLAAFAEAARETSRTDVPNEALVMDTFASVQGIQSHAAATPHVHAYEPVCEPEQQAQSTEDIFAEVQAVMAQVEQRVARAARQVPQDGPEPVVLHPGYALAVDTNAPPCDLHLTGEIPQLNVIPGTNIVLESESVEVSPAPAESAEHVAFSFDSVVHQTAPRPSTHVGALSRGTHPHDESHAPRQRQWIPRVAVLSSLGLATVGVPMLANATEGTGDIAAEAANDLANVGPSTISLLNEASAESDLPSAIAQSVTEDERAVLVASRSSERTALEDCDASTKPAGSNGQLDMSAMCKVMDGYFLQPEAATSFMELNQAFNARFGHDLCLVSGYRSLSNQYAVKKTKGSLAATPGTSNHGWGNAVDLCSSSYQSPVKWEWLHANAPTFGWDLPDWASRTYEPWHWEFTKGVLEESH